MYLERRALPKSNKITYKRYVDKCQQLHRDRLKKIKSTLDNKPPKKHKHLRRNLKREQMMEERFATIERENRILLSKMSEIMQKNTLDNKNKSIKYSHSLNKASRQRELRRITNENQAILQRIQRREPVYNHYQWEEERLANERYLKNIMEYPGGAGDSTLPRDAGAIGTTSMAVGLMGDDYAMSGYGRLEPMDPEYERKSRERLEQRSDSPPFPEGPDPQQGRGGGAGGAGAGGNMPEGDEATRFSSGVKLGADYFMLSQTNAGEITLYNPFTSQTHALELPEGFEVPEDLDAFRAMVDRVTRREDGSFTLS